MNTNIIMSEVIKKQSLGEIIGVRDEDINKRTQACFSERKIIALDNKLSKPWSTDLFIEKASKVLERFPESRPHARREMEKRLHDRVWTYAERTQKEECFSERIRDLARVALKDSSVEALAYSYFLRAEKSFNKIFLEYKKISKGTSLEREFLERLAHLAKTQQQRKKVFKLDPEGITLTILWLGRDNSHIY